MNILDLTPKQVLRLSKKIDLPNVDWFFLRAVAPEYWPEEVRTQCWPWTGTIKNRGRAGQMVPVRKMFVPTFQRLKERPIHYFEKRQYTAALFTTLAFVRELDEHETVKSICRGHYCVNPIHHEIVNRKKYRERVKPWVYPGPDTIPPADEAQEMEELMDAIEQWYGEGLYTLEELKLKHQGDYTENEVIRAIKKIGPPISTRFGFEEEKEKKEEAYPIFSNVEKGNLKTNINTP